MEDFSLLYWIMKKHTESEKDTQPLSSASAKRTRRGKECTAFGCSNAFYTSLIAGITWSRGKVTSMGLMFPQILFYVTTILRKKISKSHFWDGSCY